MFGKKLVGTLGAGLAALGVAVAAAPAQAATFTVNTADNGGPGSLRSAINAAEAHPAARQDRVRDPRPRRAHDRARPRPAGPHAAAHDQGLLAAGRRTGDRHRRATPKIVIDADNAERGLDIAGDEIEIRGLVVKNAEEAGIRVEGTTTSSPATTSAPTPPATRAGRTADTASTVVGRNNVIGGDEPTDRNVISSNLDARSPSPTAPGNIVEGNRIGTNAAGTAGLGGSHGRHRSRARARPCATT